MALKEGKTPIIIGLAVDSSCGKSTFMRHVTSTFGGDQCGPLSREFGISDMAIVICLDNYYLNDRGRSKILGLTMLNTAKQCFDLMFKPS